MPREKGSGVRYPIKRTVIKSAGDHDPDWSKCESILGRPLDEEIQAEIILANDLYAVIGPAHDPRRTILSSSIAPLIDDWMKASRALQNALSTEKENSEASVAIGTPQSESPSRAHVIARFWGHDAARDIGKMLPLQFLDLVAAAALDASKVVSYELAQLNTSMKNDLWSAWLALVARALVSGGIKVSVSGPNKSGLASSFVRLIYQIEEKLPLECRRCSGGDSAAKIIQTALRKTRHLNRKDLLLDLAGYGSQIVTDYPGDIEKRSSEKTEEVMDLLQARLRKQDRRQVLD